MTSESTSFEVGYIELCAFPEYQDETFLVHFDLPYVPNIHLLFLDVARET